MSAQVWAVAAAPSEVTRLQVMASSLDPERPEGARPMPLVTWSLAGHAVLTVQERHRWVLIRLARWRGLV